MTTKFFHFLGHEVTSIAMGPSGISLRGLFDKVRGLEFSSTPSRAVAERGGKFFLLIARHYGAYSNFDEVPLIGASLEDVWAIRLVRAYVNNKITEGDLWSNFQRFSPEDKKLILQTLLIMGRNEENWKKERMRLRIVRFPNAAEFYPDQVREAFPPFRNMTEETLRVFLSQWRRLRLEVLWAVIEAVLDQQKEESGVWPPKSKRNMMLK